VTHATTGAGGPTVVLVSGLSQPGARWRRVAALLAERGYTVVTLDNRGCGASPRFDDEFTLTDCALDVIETLDGLGIDGFHLAGISMGGMIAQEMLALAADRVDAAGLLATMAGQSYFVPPPDPAILMAPSPQELWRRLTGPGFADAHPDVIEEEAQLSVDAATPLETIMRQVQAIAVFDPLDRLDGLDLPVLAIHGDHDVLIPYENGVRLAKKLGCELVTLEGAGHALEFERPVEVADLLDRHFRR
jgi:pimeloyl-ACP methyl ester carboxylesterase